jgi:hypothetical protein
VHVTEVKHPTALISYSHDSPEHEQRVLDLSNRLRARGIDALVDQIDGHVNGHEMVMSGADYPEAGVTRMHRVTWTPRSDGSVEELWQISLDAGRVWRNHFDGIFRRVKIDG